MKLDLIENFLNFCKNMPDSHAIAIPLKSQLFHAGKWTF